MKATLMRSPGITSYSNRTLCVNHESRDYKYYSPQNQTYNTKQLGITGDSRQQLELRQVQDTWLRPARSLVSSHARDLVLLSRDNFEPMRASDVTNERAVRNHVSSDSSRL